MSLPIEKQLSQLDPETQQQIKELAGVSVAEILAKIDDTDVNVLIEDNERLRLKLKEMAAMEGDPDSSFLSGIGIGSIIGGAALGLLGLPTASVIVGLGIISEMLSIWLNARAEKIKEIIGDIN